MSRRILTDSAVNNLGRIIADSDCAWVDACRDAEGRRSGWRCSVLLNFPVGEGVGGVVGALNGGRVAWAVAHVDKAKLGD